MAQRKRVSGNSTKEKAASRGQLADANEGKRGMNPHVKDEIWAVIIIAIGVFLVVAFQTHAAGAAGEALSKLFKGCLGAIAYAFPYYLIFYGILLFGKKTISIGGKSAVLLFLILLMASIINAARFIDPHMLGFSTADAKVYYGDGIELDSGGLFGMYIGSLLVKAFGIPGLHIVSFMVIVICLLLIINTPISRFFEKAAEKRRARKEAERLERLEEEEQVFVPDLAPELLAELPSEPILEVPRPDIEKPGSEEPAPCEEPVSQPAKKRLTIFERLAQERDARRKGAENSYVPGNISESQRRILAYMQDDDLFSQPESEPGYGLEEGADTFSKAYDMLEPEEGTNPDPKLDASVSEEREESVSAPSQGDCERFCAGDGPPTEPMDATAQSPTADVVPKKTEKLTNSQAVGAALAPGEIRDDEAMTVKPYKLPPVELLKRGKAQQNKAGTQAQLRAKASKLEETLRNFNIDAEVVQVTQGPAVTRFEIHPNVGVKVKSIVNLADDIALNLEARSIRIEAPIPGKAAVGIEIENDKVNMVTIREIIDSKAFKTAKSKITFAVGKDIAGKAVVADLKGMPHMLIAGSTGSGKSVCVNSIITSILYKARPEEVKLVLIDPKVVELTNYNGIPHLLIPVVTEPAKAAAALNWAVTEMEDRYKKFAKEGVRELASYNETVKKRSEDDAFLPQVVIIIDELADLMMAAPSQVEESICRLAQKARAAGMHLIVATQRPSVDVITGVIKANIPSRIAFAVSSQFDSRTILDMAGAERLVGKGDMLFNPMGGGKPTRVQGTFISDQEVHDVIQFVKGQMEETEYADDVMHTIEKANAAESPGDTDPLLQEAIETVVSAKQASVSMLQRRFRIGYNRAARIVDMMEARGIVGPSEGSKSRQVLMTEAELQALQEGTEDLQEG